MAELADLRRFRATVSDPRSPEIALARADLVRSIDASTARVARSRAPRVRLLVAIVALVVAGSGLAIGRSGVLDGPPAPAVEDTALQNLFPPLHIGHATVLASYTFFGARTAAGGYCFSATSPLDPRAEGGHCVSAASVNRLDAGKPVSVLTSDWSVGGYAPGAATIHITGTGIDVTDPVAANGWWTGVADPTASKPLTEGTVVATALAPDGSVVGTTSLYRIRADANRDAFAILRDP